ncbi:MAG: peptidylprolyl isomerase [Candidatus Omnitrophica bacterium]|nr:peptidylprolyl isomerase [Candidatus Omnitrophota bacterium]
MKKILWVVAILIIIAFGFGSQVYLLRDKAGPSYAGKVFNKKISFEEFRKNFRQTQIQAFIQYGENFEKIREYLNLESQTWDRIILLHEAKKRKIKISNKEVVETIHNYPFFQRDGKFDSFLYNDILQYVFKVKARDFEESVRDSLKIVHIFEQESIALTIPGKEVLDSYKKENEKVQISYILFSDEEHTNKIIFDDSKAKDFYVVHKENFRLPPSINVSYLRFDYPAAEPTDKEPGPENPVEETTQEEISEEGKEATLRQAQEITDQIALEEDFTKVAQEHNLSIETSGFFSMEQPLLIEGWSFPLIQQLFQLDVHKTLGPVETSSGYQILTVTAKKDSFIPSYEEVIETVRETWIANEARKIAEKQAEKYYKIIRETFNSLKRPDFAKIAKEHQLNIHQTPLFNRGQYLPKLGIAKDFQEVAFILNESNKLSQIVETEKGYCLLHLDEREPIDEEKFAKVKNEFTEKLLAEKKNTSFEDFLTHLRIRANIEDNMVKQKGQK